MSHAFEAVRVSSRVYWVGAIDWELRNFHGYLTSRGSTYNAFLITGSEPVLLDTVKAPFVDEMMSRIASVMDPKEIRTLVSHHAELDHSGSLPSVLEQIKPDRLFASKAGAGALKAHFHWDQSVDIVKDGQVLRLGDATLRFIDARMLHWPDSIFSYLDQDQILFTNDGFGMHLASSERFVDELDESLCIEEAAKYYANILLPYSHLIPKLAARLEAL